MKKTALLLFVAFITLLQTNSCKQCSTPKETTTDTTDSTDIPTLKSMNEAIKLDSLNPVLYYKRALLYEANGDLKSAITDMYLALSIDTLRPELYLYTADLFKKSGEPIRGISLMNKAIATDSFHIPFYVKAAELAYIDTNIAKHYGLALDYLNTAIQKDPQNADVYFYKGNVYKEAGDTSKAISSFQTATELNPKFYDAFMQIGLLLKEKKDKNAAKYFDNAIRVKENGSDALYAKANVLKEEGVKLYDANKLPEAVSKLQQAIAAFKQVIEQDHRNVEAYMGIGFSYYQMDSVREAYEYYDKALKIAPTYAGAHFSKGLCAEELGKTKEAIMLFQNCLNIDPEFSRATKHLKDLQGN